MSSGFNFLSLKMMPSFYFVLFRFVLSSTVSDVRAGNSDCSEYCDPRYREDGSRIYLEYCCEENDLCNDDPIPVEHLQKIISKSPV